MPIYPNRNNPFEKERDPIPNSILSKAKEKDTLQWLYNNAEKYEKKYNLPSGVLLPLAGHESANYQKAVSSGTGPRGLFQISKQVARAYGLRVDQEHDDRLDLDKSTDAAARLLAERLKANKGDLLKSLAQYNGGIEASQWVNGRTHEYDPGNGNPGELYGFLRGVANYAKEWGRDDIYDTLYPAFSERRDQILQMKEKMREKGYDVTVDGSWGKKLQSMWDKAVQQNPEMDPDFVKTEPTPIKKYLNNFEFTKTEPKNYVENPLKDEPDTSDVETPSEKPKSKASPQSVKSEQKRDPKEVRVFEEGGKMVQQAEGSEDVALQGEERIYSIPDTKKIVEMAQKATDEKSIKALGEFIYKATKKQDERPVELTDS